MRKDGGRKVDFEEIFFYVDINLGLIFRNFEKIL